MIAFQHIKTGEYLGTLTNFERVSLLCDAFPFHECDETPRRKRHPELSQYRTVFWSRKLAEDSWKKR